MRRHPFLVFIAVIGALIASVVWFIQSPAFARAVKNVVAKYIPGDPGIEGDFTGLAVKLFPPGISIVNPRIELRKRNILNLPPGSEVRAERVDLEFLPFQMFSGNIRVHQVVVVNGEVSLQLGDAAPKKAKAPSATKSDFHWDELFHVHAEAIAVRNTRLRIVSSNPELSLSLKAEQLRLGQWSGKGGLGYELDIDVSEIEASFLKEIPLLSGGIGRLRATAHGNALGLQIDALALEKEGMQANATGALHGDLLSHPKDLVAEGALTLKAELSRLLVGTSVAGKTDGRLTFEGRAKASFERFPEGVKLEGKAELEDARYEKWRADKVSVDGSYVSGPKGGELSIARAVVFARERERVGGQQPGEGGRLELAPLRIPFGAPAPIEAELKLERAHLHWLAAPALKDVYPLDFRASGKIGVRYQPGPAAGAEGDPWSLHAKLDLGIEKFQLDNQALGKSKPLRRVLKIPALSVVGDVDADAEGLHLAGLTLALPHTQLHATGTVAPGPTYDVRAGGEIDLHDFGELAEQEIRGEGTLFAHIHGPSTRVFVDFDTDLREAFYLKLKLGDLRGRITFDEDPDDVIFNEVRVARGGTRYSVDGKIQLVTDKVDLNVPIEKGFAQDFIHIFELEVKDFWWFPQALTGQLSGRVKVGGGLGMDKLDVQAQVGGGDWEFYGERFKDVRLTGGYTRGRYHIDNIVGTKHAGSLSGRISFDENRMFDWDFATTGLSVSDLDHIAQLDVPIRGRVDVTSGGKGKEGAIQSETHASVSDVSVRGVGLAPSQLDLKSQGGILRAQGSALGGEGTLDLTYDSNEEKTSYLRAELRRFDFSPTLLLLNPKSIQDRALAGNVSGAVNLSFRAGEAERASGTVDLTEYTLARGDTRFDLAQPLSFKIDNGTFDILGLSLRGPQGEATLDLRSRRAAIDGTVTGDLDASIAEFFSSSIGGVSGTAALDLSLGGTLKDPTIFGKAVLNGVSLRVPSVESPFENVTGTMQLRQNILRVQNVEGDLAGGRVSADGTISLHADRYPEVALKGQVSGSKLKVYPFQYVKTHGGVSVTGDKVPYQIEGALVVDSALTHEKVLGQKQGGGSKALQYTPPPTPERGSDYPKFKLDIDAVAERGVLVQNDLFNCELKGHVKIVNTLEAPRVVGTAELLSGQMIFKDRTFQIQSADANFDNPTKIDPAFNMTANTEVNGVKIQLFTSGRLSDYKVEMTSNPVMPEPEILSLLALGMTSSEAKRFSPGDRSVFEQGEAVSTLLHSLDFNRDIESKTGIQIQLDESVNPQIGASAFRPQSQVDSTTSPRVVLRKPRVIEIFRKPVDVSAASTVSSGGTSGTRLEGNAELHLSPGLSAIGVITNQTSGTADTQERSTSYGFDMKWQARFK
jgi:autotransporter translocation and assembly factor TamB